MAGTSPSWYFLPDAGVDCPEPTQPFSFRTHFLPSDRKQKVTSPAGGRGGGGAGWGPSRGEVHPGHLPRSLGYFSPRPGLGPEGRPVTWAGLKRGQPFPGAGPWPQHCRVELDDGLRLLTVEPWVCPPLLLSSSTVAEKKKKN